MKKNNNGLMSDYATEYLTNVPRIEIVGSHCLVDGLTGIDEYSPDRIKILMGKKSITFIGSDMEINSFSHTGAMIEGIIIAVEFSS